MSRLTDHFSSQGEESGATESMVLHSAAFCAPPDLTDFTSRNRESFLFCRVSVKFQLYLLTALLSHHAVKRQRSLLMALNMMSSHVAPYYNTSPNINQLI